MSKPKVELDIERILQEYNRGTSVTELTMLYGVSETTIRNRLRPFPKHRNYRRSTKDTWDTYNDYIKQLRDAGATLQEIADEVGLKSRERPRQILVEHYGTSDIESKDLIATSQLAELANCSVAIIYKLQEKGIIIPATYPRKRARLWKKETITTIIEVRRCKICGKPLPKHREVYCSDACRIEAGKYKNRPPEQRKAHSLHVRRWRERHPERAKEIQEAATRNYQLRHTFAHRFSSIILISLGKEGKMERYPYQAAIIQKEAIPRGGIKLREYAFLVGLKDQLQPGQAIQLVAPDAKKKGALATSWRRVGKGSQPKTHSRKQEDGSYIIYLWLEQ